MKKISRYLGIFLLAVFYPALVYAGSLSSVSGTAQICPMEDGSGKYMLKSDGFYCLDENGALSTKEEIHYFDHFSIDGTVFDGYYYHDKDGVFRAASPRLVQIRDVAATKTETDSSGETEDIQTVIKFSGVFMVGNLGKMSASPQVRYLNQEKLDVVYDGYYYFNENGRLLKEEGSHYLHMSCNGKDFDGYYYFGSTGALTMEAGMTPDGFPIDGNGRVGALEDLGMETLEPRIEGMVSEMVGDWSVFVKDLDTGEEFLITDRRRGSASLIKVFVMAASYQNMEVLRKHEAKRLNLDAADEKVQKKIEDLLWNMITISDNESFNELVRLHSANHDFIEGARILNQFIQSEGYTDTRVMHTLMPSASSSTGIGESNLTSALDCGRILERIYAGECVSEEASESMRELLLNQSIDWKIPTALPSGVLCANKTGENDFIQNDIAIVYGEQTDFILCILCDDYKNEGDTFDDIREVTKVVYQYLNINAK